MKLFKCPKCGGPNFGMIILSVIRDGQEVRGFSGMESGDEVAERRYDCHNDPCRWSSGEVTAVPEGLFVEKAQ